MVDAAKIGCLNSKCIGLQAPVEFETLQNDNCEFSLGPKLFEFVWVGEAVGNWVCCADSEGLAQHHPFASQPCPFPSANPLCASPTNAMTSQNVDPHTFQSGCHTREHCKSHQNPPNDSCILRSRDKSLFLMQLAHKVAVLLLFRCHQ